MSFIKVKNKKGTSGKIPLPEYSSWLDFWEKIKGKKANICEVFLCDSDPDVGGHAIK